MEISPHKLGTTNNLLVSQWIKQFEKTINKDTQTPGGAKRFGTKKGTVSRYYITADYRASCIRQLRYMADMAFDIQI